MSTPLEVLYIEGNFSRENDKTWCDKWMSVCACLCECVCIKWCYTSEPSVEKATHGGKAVLHSLIFVSESNEGHLTLLFFFVFLELLNVVLSWIFLKTKEHSLIFLSYLFSHKCTVGIFFPLHTGEKGSGIGLKKSRPSGLSEICPTPAPLWEDPPPGRAHRLAMAGCVWHQPGAILAGCPPPPLQWALPSHALGGWKRERKNKWSGSVFHTFYVFVMLKRRKTNL